MSGKYGAPALCYCGIVRGGGESGNGGTEEGCRESSYENSVFQKGLVWQSGWEKVDKGCERKHLALLWRLGSVVLELDTRARRDSGGSGGGGQVGKGGREGKHVVGVGVHCSRRVERGKSLPRKGSELWGHRGKLDVLEASKLASRKFFG